MATIIDSLIVTLGLDSKDVDAKAPSVRRKLTDLERASSETEKGFKGLTGAIGTFATAISGIVGIGAMAAFVKDLTQTNTHLYYLSRALGTNAQSLYAWGQVAAAVGGNAASIQGYFLSIRNIYGQMVTGQNPNLLPFALLGVSPFADPDKIAWQEDQRFQQMQKRIGTPRAASVFRALGIPEDLINVFLKNPSWTQKRLEEYRKNAPTTPELKASADLTTQLVSAKTAINKLGNDLLAKIEPLLKRLIVQLERIVAWMDRHSGLTSIVLGAGVGITVLASILSIFKMLGSVLTPIVTIIGRIALGLASFVDWPILAVVAAIAALSAAIYEMHKHWKAFRELWDKFTVSDVSRKIGDAFNWIAENIDKATDSLNKWLKARGIDSSRNSQDKQLQSAAGMSGLPAGGGLRQQVTAQQIEQYFRSKGYAPGWAAGIASNIMAESGGITNARGDNGLAYGLAQWHPEWQAKFKSMYGIPLSQATWQQQLAFIDWAMRKQRRIDVARDPGAAWASAYFTKTYEKPKDIAEQTRLRSAFAQSLIGGVSNATSVPSSVSSSSSTSSISTDNSRVTHIGTINMQNPSSSRNIAPSTARGMDWTTLLSQQNFGLQ